MNGKAKLFMSILGLGAVLTALPAIAQEKSVSLGGILFKIQDVTPEKNADGSVKYCSLRATFINRTSVDVVNAALALTWHDDVIGDAIDAEERAANEAKRNGSQAASPRYSTAGFTSKSVQASLKLPPLKSGQQISLKTNVATDRCFLLLNDMDINVTNCGSADMIDKSSQRGCTDLFRYVSPKEEEYYVEFSDVTPQQQQALEASQINELKKGIDTAYSDALASIQAITAEATEPEKKNEE
jgi:hypothetical protein